MPYNRYGNYVCEHGYQANGWDFCGDCMAESNRKQDKKPTPRRNDWQGARLKINDLVNNNKITKKDLIKSINDILWESCKI